MKSEKIFGKLISKWLWELVKSRGVRYAVVWIASGAFAIPEVYVATICSWDAPERERERVCQFLRAKFDPLTLGRGGLLTFLVRALPPVLGKVL